MGAWAKNKLARPKSAGFTKSINARGLLVIKPSHVGPVETRILKALEELDPAFRNVKASLWYRAAELVGYGTERKPLDIAKKQGGALVRQ
jgi:hypothetical protein